MLGSGSWEIYGGCASFLSFPPSFQVTLEPILGLISLTLFQRLQVGIGSEDHELNSVKPFSDKLQNSVNNTRSYG